MDTCTGSHQRVAGRLHPLCRVPLREEGWAVIWNFEYTDGSQFACLPVPAVQDLHHSSVRRPGRLEIANIWPALPVPPSALRQRLSLQLTVSRARALSTCVRQVRDCIGTAQGVGSRCLGDAGNCVCYDGLQPDIPAKDAPRPRRVEPRVPPERGPSWRSCPESSGSP